MNNSNRREKYSVSVGNNQLVLILNSEILLPEDAPVRVTSAQLEELDYRKLYKAYSSRGRKSVTDPRVLFKVMAYGYRSLSTKANFLTFLFPEQGDFIFAN